MSAELIPATNKVVNRPFRSAGEHNVKMQLDGQMTDTVLTFHATTDQTNNYCTITEIHWTQEDHANHHFHRLEDEGFYVIEGSITVHTAEGDVPVGPGEIAWGPRGLRHAYSVPPGGARVLLLQVPGTELTGFFKGASRLGDALDDPKEAERFVDWAAEEYGVQFLDPSVYPPGQSVIDPRAERPASRGNLALPAVEHVITNKTIKSSGERRVKSRFAADPANGPEWIFHLSGTQTGGGVGLIEIIWPAGDTTPFHTHSTEDRAFYVVEGSLDIVLEDSELNLGAGQLGWVPRFTRHAYRVGSEGARVLMSYYPGTSLDRLFELTASIEGITSSPENFEQWAAWAADNFGVLFEQPTSAGDGAAASEAALATGRG